MSKLKIGVIVGSLRRESYSRKVADYVSGLLSKDVDVQRIQIGNLTMYNQDYDDDGSTPAEWTQFREQIKSLDGFLFVTPEYNRSVPPVLKNALDIASRPYGQNVWDGKPGAVISVSPGRLSGFGSNHHLRQSLSFLNIYTMQQPEAYFGNIESALDEDGTIKDDGIKKILQNVADEFLKWMNRFN